MHVLIVESDEVLGGLWQAHLERRGLKVRLEREFKPALAALRLFRPDVVVLNGALNGGGALSIADYAFFELPQSQVIFVTSDTFFSNGEIFSLTANGALTLGSTVSLNDLAAIVEHYGQRAMASQSDPRLCGA